MAIGQVYKIHSDFYYVKYQDKIFECKLREVLKKQKQQIYVGDFVEFIDGAIIKIQPRKNYITHPTVANIDQVVIISAVKEPNLDFLQLNRYISFAKYFKIQTVLCFNKNDLSSDDKLIEKVFSIYEPLGFDIVFTSAIEDLGIEAFVEVLENKTSVLCGSSGVGKSSLINAVSKNKVNLRTGEVSDKTQRGTHTTRHSEIIELNNKTRVIDTPGFSHLKFDFLLPNEVDLLFDEISQYKQYCKFQNCLHINEVGCCVKDNINEIDETRYESYVNFVKEALEYKEKVKYNGKKIETKSKINNEKNAVKISSRKRQSSRNTQKQNIYKEAQNEEFN